MGYLKTCTRSFTERQ